MKLVKRFSSAIALAAVALSLSSCCWDRNPCAEECAPRACCPPRPYMAPQPCSPQPVCPQPYNTSDGYGY